MLQRNQIPPSLDLRNRPAELPSLAETFDAFISYLLRQYWIILGTAGLCLFAGICYLMTAAPSYTALATMIMDTRKFQVMQQQSPVTDAPVDSSAVESQVEILKSENVALAVIRDLKLADDPEFVGSRTGAAGAVLDFVSGLFTRRAPLSEFDRTRRAVRTFQKQLDVRRRGMTYVIEISFRSLDPERAAQIANAVADAYIVDQLDSKYQATRRASVWLQDRIQELRSQASNAERAVLDYKKANNIVTSSGKLLDEQQLGELNTQLVQVKSQVADAKAKLDRIEAVVKAGAPDATVADTLNNQVITKLRSQYLELANREADWSSRYGYNHLAAVNLRNQMREVQSSMMDELKRLAESYKSDYAIALQRQNEIERAVNESVSQSQSTNQAQVTLRELQSSAQTYRSLYDNFLQRYMENVQQQSFPVSEARVITRASRPLSKSHPQTLVVLAISTLGGLIAGLGLGVLRDLYDRVFRTADMVEAILDTDCIAIVPRVPPGQIKAAVAAGRPSLPGAPRAIQRGAEPVLWAAIDAPFSRFSEAIRSIKVNADLNVTKPSKILGLTSALPNEGKSTLAFVFAQLVSQSGARVLLVDCDLRNPSLSRKVAATAERGILDVLSNNATLHDTVWRDPETGLAFLPGATRSRIAHSHDVLASDQMKEFIDRARGHYDYVIVDFPPLTPVVDVRTTAHFVDSFIFVVEWGKTQVQVVERALRSARAVNENLLGVVLNKADIAAMSRYSGYGGKNYYYNSHYGRYGYTE
ncbi:MULTISPECIES: polysaccharide biosynthesis tyrosine autokinase [Bradyrhizobium]|jgi:succinoglycan biosynthesis transport protein ExoP|uniref:polysaccharide biosynthesis tyrosine autokinase n=1 Tax=Bradyrhizobium TaxID=374 RepID=UPI0003F89C8A|nr:MULTISPECIES: polysaccharide biosynthesis tyrosine autokinase [Bradyrhizobium]KIU45299.1 exopolysaccharide biosynthesis protein [Bradyrhizobium elkanii]MBK5654747.1 polysaccharide biosynthesis tyrosine autokinase [Rhizobium sp.]OCX30164.1 exopolysaccharide biosynthesis protein [Bradyrhizobium sp. UASWS1016]